MRYFVYKFNCKYGTLIHSAYTHLHTPIQKCAYQWIEIEAAAAPAARSTPTPTKWIFEGTEKNGARLSLSHSHRSKLTFFSVCVVRRRTRRSFSSHICRDQKIKRKEKVKKKEILKIASKRDVYVQQEASILYVLLYKYIHIHIIQIQATEKCNYICVWKFCAFFSFASPFFCFASL